VASAWPVGISNKDILFRCGFVSGENLTLARDLFELISLRLARSMPC
jgi:hypothetical protein